MGFNLDPGKVAAGIVPIGKHQALIADVTPSDGEEKYLKLAFQVDGDPPKVINTFDLIDAEETSPRFNETGKGAKFALSVLEAVGADPAEIAEGDDFIRALLGQKVTVLVAHRGDGIMRRAVIKSVSPPEASVPAKEK